MGLISRASAAWEALWGGRALPVERAELVDLPLRRAANVSRGTAFQVLPSIATRKHARAGSWDLLEAYNDIPALRTCVDLLAPAAARIAYEFYKVRKPAERRHFERLVRHVGAEKERLRRAMVDAGDLEAVPDHPAALFLRRGVEVPMLGYPLLTSFEARTLLYKYDLLVGEGFEIIERRGVGAGRSKRGVPWGRLTIVPTDVHALPTAREPYYVIRDADGAEQNVPAEDVLYRRQVNPRDPYGRGTGPAHALDSELEIDRLQTDHMADAWGSGTIPPVLVVGDFGRSGAPGVGPFGLTDGETGVKTARMLQEWQQAVDRNRPYFLDGADADGKPNITVHDLSRSMQQMEAQASRSATWSNIAQVIGRIPPELRGITGNSNRATAQAGWYLLQTGVLLSWAEQEASFIRDRILPEWEGESLEVDFISPVDRDFEAELRVMQARPQAFMIDEFRKRAGEEELPDDKGQVFVWSPADVPVKDPSQDPFAGAGQAPASKKPEGPGGEQEAKGEDDSSDGSGGAVGDELEESGGTTAKAAHGSALVPGEHEARPVRIAAVERNPLPGVPAASEHDRALGRGALEVPQRENLGAPGEESVGRQGAPVDGEHALVPVPGQDQLDPEAALRGTASEGLGKAAHLIRVPEEAGAGVRAPGNGGEGRAEGAVVEVADDSGLDHVRAGQAGEAQVKSLHSASLVPTPAEVNRAASYVTLDRIAAAMEPRLRDLLLGVLDRARSRVSEGLLVQAIEDGNEQRVIQLLRGEELARDLRRAQGLLGEVFKAAGIAASESLAGQLGREVVFSGASTRALSWAPQRSEDLAAWVRQSIEETGRNVLDHGRELAWGAAATAGAVMLTYGLASYLIEGRKAGPAFAVLSHREALEAAGETAEVARAAAESYRSEMVAQRAALFGGDQSYSAAQAGQHESWRQAKDKGLLPETVKRYWVTRDDRRVCPICDGLHGQKRGLDEPFTSAADGQSYTNAGPYDGPHDGCRCALLIVGLRGWNS